MALPQDFPEILPEDESLQWYHGFMSVQNHEFRLRVRFQSAGSKAPQSGQSASKSTSSDGKSGKDLKLAASSPNTDLFVDHDLFDLLRGFEGVLQQRLLQCKDLHGVLTELRDVIDRVLRTKPMAALPPSDYYSRILKEVETIGWDKLASLDESLTSISLRLSDDCKREHLVTVKLANDFPASAPSCAAELPCEVELGWTPRSSLRDVLSQYQKAIYSLQDFFAVMDDFDRHTWVLEPEHPTHSATMRRIALGKSNSLQVEVDPRKPRAVCECRFLGAEAVIGPLKSSLNSANLFTWDEKELPRVNLERILKTKFPVRGAAKSEELSMECGICYAYRVGQSLPDRVCDNVKCSRPFHRACLYEWLKSLPTSREAFNTVFGACPYCSHPVTATAS